MFIFVTTTYATDNNKKYCFLIMYDYLGFLNFLYMLCLLLYLWTPPMRPRRIWLYFWHVDKFLVSKIIENIQLLS